jgi:hypothetical protein
MSTVFLSKDAPKPTQKTRRNQSIDECHHSGQFLDPKLHLPGDWDFIRGSHCHYEPQHHDADDPNNDL